MRESAGLVLEENQLLREADEEMRHTLEQVQMECKQRVTSAEEELTSQRMENTRLAAAQQRLQEEVTLSREAEQKGREERRNWVSAEQHARAVAECQEAFQELKLNYKKDTVEKDETIETLQKEVVKLKSCLDASTVSNAHLEADVRLNSKMALKFEELSLTLQVRKGIKWANITFLFDRTKFCPWQERRETQNNRWLIQPSS